MDFNKMSLFGMVKKKLNWLGQRQEILAQNIANSDTPKYRASDLKPYDFQELVRKEANQLFEYVYDEPHNFLFINLQLPKFKRMFKKFNQLILKNFN